MEPQSPVVIGLEPYEILGAGGAEYLPLPTLRSPAPQSSVLSRWAPTPEERRLIAEGADVFLCFLTFGQPYPPTQMFVMRATADPELIREQMNLDQELNERLRAIYARSAVEPSKEHQGEPHE